MSESGKRSARRFWALAPARVRFHSAVNWRVTSLTRKIILLKIGIDESDCTLSCRTKVIEDVAASGARDARHRVYDVRVEPGIEPEACSPGRSLRPFVPVAQVERNS